MITPIYIAEEYLTGNCTCPCNKEFAHLLDRAGCKQCVDNFTIYSNDATYEKITRLFNLTQTPVNAIQEFYIMYGKCLESTVSALLCEFELDEHKLYAAYYEQFPDDEDIIYIPPPKEPIASIPQPELPVYDPLPDPIPVAPIPQLELPVYDPLPDPIPISALTGNKRPREIIEILDDDEPIAKKPKFTIHRHDDWTICPFDESEIPDDCEIITWCLPKTRQPFAFEIREINKKKDPLRPFAWEPLCFVQTAPYVWE